MKKQLIILWIGICLVVLAGLFPPSLEEIGFVFLFGIWSSTINLTQLTIEVLIVALLTAGALYTVKKTDGK